MFRARKSREPHARIGGARAGQTGHTRVGKARRQLAFGAAALAALALSAGATVAVADSGGGTVTYTATQTVPVPPSANYAGSAGGDGWAVAVSDGNTSVFSQAEIFNVFHHQGTLQVACHYQADASPCWSPETITDSSAHGFATSGHPGLYLDQNTGHLYVWGTRTSDSTGGVVCIDTTVAATNTDPFCGFTALTPVGNAQPPGISAISDGALIGDHWYAFNFYEGQPVGDGENELLCFDVSTDAACAGQPFDLNVGSGVDDDGDFPPPAIAAIAEHVIVPIDIGGTQEFACFDDSTQTACGAGWPIDHTSGPDGYSYDSSFGAPFPLLDASGTIEGFCVPTGTDQCYDDDDGDALPTPAGMTSALPGTSGWDGPAFVLGPRVYLPDGNTNQVLCFDYSTGASCSGCTSSQCTAGSYPRQMADLGLQYTVNADPQRPTCIWVNSDNGSEQIQSFDAYTGEGCGSGAIRVLASQFVVPLKQCAPTSYDALQILQPPPSTYAAGTISFEDADGNPIPGASDVPLDASGTAGLAGLSLNSSTGSLPQFLINLDGLMGTPGQVVAQLTWDDTYNPLCTSTGVTATAPVTTPTPTTTDTETVTVTSTQTLPGTTETQTVTTPGATTTVTTPVTTTIKTASPVTTPTCPAPVGAVGGSSVGALSIGMTQQQARATLQRYDVTQNKFDNFCLYHGWGIRLGYPTAALLKTVAASARSHFRGHVALALTANPYYALSGARPGQAVASVAKRLHLGKPFHVGTNDWYFGAAGYARGVLKVRHGVIQEVGLATLALTQSTAQQRLFINSFDKL